MSIDKDLETEVALHIHSGLGSLQRQTHFPDSLRVNFHALNFMWNGNGRAGCLESSTEWLMVRFLQLLL